MCCQIDNKWKLTRSWVDDGIIRGLISHNLTKYHAYVNFSRITCVTHKIFRYLNCLHSFYESRGTVAELVDTTLRWNDYCGAGPATAPTLHMNFNSYLSQNSASRKLTKNLMRVCRLRRRSSADAAVKKLTQCTNAWCRVMYTFTYSICKN